MNRNIFVCACHNLDHIISIYKDPEIDLFILEIRLNNNKKFIQRIIHAIKYIFGYKSNFGDYDEFVLNNDDKSKLINILLASKH